ncbi:RSP_7527 family protein [Ostreiculturibacter nitratireducens]|uniref:RSP_7527 family protein n=1 Tax=Ostreiculturibacter nitratireducens TaxID=3075226 RepID=UPI0031B63886
MTKLNHIPAAEQIDFSEIELAARRLRAEAAREMVVAFAAMIKRVFGSKARNVGGATQAS